MPTFLEQFNAARRVSVPLVVVQTPDPTATIKTIATSAANASSPMILWDCARGLVGVNEPQGKHVAKLLNDGMEPGSLCNPTEMLVRALKMPQESIIFMSNLHRFMTGGGEAPVLQAFWNLRNEFKTNTRMMVVLCPGFRLPPEIASDVLVLDEPLPSLEQLGAIVTDTYKAVKLQVPDLAMPTQVQMDRITDALCGLPAFPAEQVCAMSATKTGLNIDQVWERKRQQIEQTPGLTVWRGGEKFSDIGGCDNIKQFASRILNGRKRPRAIVFQDEIEKAFAGATGGDLSGTSTELLGYQLSFMQDHNSRGLLFVGPPGAAKSAIAKAIGNEGEIPTIQFDLGGAKGSLVGESNANMRMILKVIEAVSQGRALWIATSNDIKGLPTELRRRYSRGTFFFDLPTGAERDAIWKIWTAKCEVADKDRPDDLGWTGAEIKNCCELAYEQEISLREAAKYIIPVAVSAQEKILDLRKEASGRYVSAAFQGPYKAPEGIQDVEPEPEMIVAFGVVKPSRKIKVEGGNTPTGRAN